MTALDPCSQAYDALREAWEDGATAFVEGVKLIECPHISSDEHTKDRARWWTDGWLAAHEMARRNA